MSNGEEKNDEWEAWKAFLEQIRHMENRAWAALNNFLVANAFLLVAWATVYDHAKLKGGEVLQAFDGIFWFMLLLPAIGFIGGIQWCLVGARNWRYVQEWDADLDDTERRLAGTRTGQMYNLLGRAKRRIRFFDGDPMLFSNQGLILSGTPLLVAVLYAVAIDIMVRPRALDWLWPVRIVEGIFIIYAVRGAWIVLTSSEYPADDPRKKA